MPEIKEAGNNAGAERGSTEVAPGRAPIRRDRIVTIGGVTLLALLTLGWTWSLLQARNAAPASQNPVVAATRAMAAATHSDAPAAAYVTDAALTALANRVRGTSGKLRAQTVLPTDTAKGGVAARIVEALKPMSDLNLITMIPFTEKKNGRVGLYYIGSWPGERGARGPSKAPADRYANPSGFIQVTQQNQDTRVSEHFRLRDFLTHDQQGVWPKYLVLQMRNVDKIELVLADLKERGINIDGVTVMSGFRTPQYNSGGGNTGGRAGLSRHMYGDAADIYIDNDHNGTMDDLNHDGRVDIRDSRIIQESVDRVEKAHPELVGGAGVYIACCGHGPFIHIDSRGYRARWIGSGGG